MLLVEVRYSINTFQCAFGVQMMLMKFGMLKVGSWCETRTVRVKTEARESILWSSLLQIGIGHEWRVLLSMLNAVWRQDVAGAASQATWLVQNSSAVFRRQCCAQWAPNRDVEKRNQAVPVLLPTLMYQLGPPWGEQVHLWGGQEALLWARREQKGMGCSGHGYTAS